MSSNTLQDQHVLAASGDDRPGILDDVSKFILEHGAIIRDVKMSNLGGRFAMLTLVGADATIAPALRFNLPAFTKRTGLHVTLSDALADGENHDGHQHLLVVRAGESTDVFRKISHLLRAVGVNVDEVSTPHEGDGLLLHLSFRLRRDFPVTNLREYIDQLLAPLKIGWELHTK